MSSTNTNTVIRMGNRKLLKQVFERCDCCPNIDFEHSPLFVLLETYAAILPSKSGKLIHALLKRLLSFRGVYVTVNPVNPDLLARAVNRLRPAGRNPTTADTDIVRRRWLLIDCDPRRASGVSSSNAEHESALAKAREIRDGLSSLGWPDPIMTDSGNGAQLMYRIDLPATDGGLVQKCTNAFALASDDAVSIDTSVHNPARIWRLPGTMNCKGDSIPERPHRMARILEEPQDIVPVSREQMQDIVSYQSEDTQTHGRPCRILTGDGPGEIA